MHTANLIDRIEAASFLKIGTSTLDKKRLYGNGPTFIKIGKRVFYDVRDLEEYLKSNRRRSTSEHTSSAR